MTHTENSHLNAYKKFRTTNLNTNKSINKTSRIGDIAVVGAQTIALPEKKSKLTKPKKRIGSMLFSNKNKKSFQLTGVKKMKRDTKLENIINQEGYSEEIIELMQKINEIKEENKRDLQDLRERVNRLKDIHKHTFII